MALPATRPRTWTHFHIPMRLLLLGLALAFVLGGGYVAVAGNPLNRAPQGPTYQTSTISPGTLRITVSATGPVTNPQSVPLSFKSSGTLTEIDVSVGQAVKAGQVVARQDTSDLQQSLNQANANLDAQLANQAKVSAGSTPQQIAAAQAQVDAAQTTLDNAQKALNTAQASRATSIAGAQADVTTANVSLLSAQSTARGAVDQMNAALQSDQTTLDNNRQLYSDQLQNFHSNWDQVQAQLNQDQTSVMNAQQTLADANTSLAATQTTVDRGNETQSVSVQN